jgi:hypothetical protein
MMTTGLLAASLAGAAAITAPHEGPSLAVAAGVHGRSGYGGMPWVSVSLRLPLGPSLSLEPEAGYWSANGVEDGLGERVRAREVGLSLVLRGRPRALRPFVGQGLVARFERVTWSHPLYAPPDESWTRLTGAFFFGVEARRGPVSAFVAARVETLVVWGGVGGKLYAGVRLGTRGRRSAAALRPPR